MAKDEVKDLIDRYENAMNSVIDDAKTGVDQSRKSWKKVKADEYTTSSWVKDSTEMYARSVNSWRKLWAEWLN